MRLGRRRWPALAAAALAMMLVVAACQPMTTTTGTSTTSTSGASPGAASAPTAPPAVVCGSAAVLNGPSTAPPGAVAISPGENVASVVAGYPSGTTFWFPPGSYTLGTGEYDQIDPLGNDTFVGAPGAVLSGQGDNDSAFAGSAPDVTIEYLTIEDFVAPQSQGVVNHNSATGWVVEHDTVKNNPKGAGVMLGSGDVLSDSCLTHNGQYGFQSYSTGTGPSGVTVTGNEISDNDTANYTSTTPGCGCSGGAKFWETKGATVTGNYVHGNASVGLWIDTDNAGFDISGNYISTNYGEGIVYEASYNAEIDDNAFVRNALGVGPTNPSFPSGAVYVSESGSDPRVAGPYGTSFTIKGNVFTDNWSGVILWENANRYCGSTANTSTGACTLVDPGVYTVASCAKDVPTSKPTGIPDYYGNCRWKTQNVSVTDNDFTYKPSAVGSGCTEANGCGFNGLFSEYGTLPPYTGWVVPDHVSNDQDDHFADNTYTGPWNFVAFSQGEDVAWTQWKDGFTDTQGSGDHFGAQDAGSTYNR